MYTSLGLLRYAKDWRPTGNGTDHLYKAERLIGRLVDLAASQNRELLIPVGLETAVLCTFNPFNTDLHNRRNRIKVNRLVILIPMWFC